LPTSCNGGLGEPRDVPFIKRNVSKAGIFHMPLNRCDVGNDGDFIFACTHRTNGENEHLPR
jgi:hypothetical protein